MNAVLAGLILVAVAAAAPALSWAQAGAGCKPYGTPIKLNFVTDSAETAYFNDYNVTGLRDVMRTRGHVIAGMHQRALGLTSSQIGFNVSGKTFAVPVQGGYCVYLREVDARFGYRAMDVFIASEYRPNTCEYRAILDHENQHVAINRQGVAEYAPRIRQALESHLAELAPRFTQDPQVGTDRSLAALQLHVDPLLDEMQDSLARRNAVIDNQNNYEAIGELCKNWDQGNVWPTQPSPPRAGANPGPRIKETRPN
jgi:hypothetical protein